MGKESFQPKTIFYKYNNKSHRDKHQKVNMQ